jgi:peptidoglycan/LPS O-acetylase OafA/YrhL
VEKREKRHILTGGLILITLGVLIILHRTAVFGFDKSWPVLLIIIGIGAIAQRGKDLGGWFIAAAGVFLLLMQNWQLDIQMVSTYILPLLLILVGANIVRKYFRKKE